VRVLGVDPGLTRCGLGVVDSLSSRRVALVDVGVSRTAPDAALADRLLHIATELDDWMDRYRPDAVAVEQVFAQRNLHTVMGTSQVMGVAILAAARRGIPVAVHTPTEVKAAVSGSGRADKAQVQAMVARILGLPEVPKPADAADALALAICHAWRTAAGTAAPGTSGPTAAQRVWAEAERATRRP
jgi:crossover junction endodeoxyribonuclease RuvC